MSIEGMEIIPFTYWLIEKGTYEIHEVLSTEVSYANPMLIEVGGVERECVGPFWTLDRAVWNAGIECPVHGRIQGLKCGKCMQAKRSPKVEANRKAKQDAGYWVWVEDGKLRFLTRLGSDNPNAGTWCSYEVRLELEEIVNDPVFKADLKETRKLERQRLAKEEAEEWKREWEKRHAASPAGRAEARAKARLNIPVTGPRIIHHTSGGGKVTDKTAPWMNVDDNWGSDA